MGDNKGLGCKSRISFCLDWTKILFAIFLLVGCQQNSGGGGGEVISPRTAGPPEQTYCGTAKSFGGATVITITGHAEYAPREVVGDPQSSGGLGAAGAARPIRRAEVWIVDPSGAIIQCSETDNSGAFSMQIPPGSGTYSVYVNTRAFNSYLRASILDYVTTNQFYSLKTTFAATVTVDVGTLQATATSSGELLAGPFNILDQLLKANDYLRAQVSTCAIAGCRDFSVAPKVVGYWKKGYNPENLLGGNNPLSFYVPGYSRLFILGGIDGDVDRSDTDHFDNTIIVHEYGHFIMDSFSKTDSPGGKHYGVKPIDPRLAFDEAWGNTFQAAVLGDARYIDTVGNTSGATHFGVYVNLEDQVGLNTRDAPAMVGEGNFREFSITRFLVDAIDTGGSNDEAIINGFAQIWAVLTKSNGGFLNSGAAFRAMGLFNYIQQTIINIQDWSPLRTLEMNTQAGGEYLREYAYYVKPDNSCASPSYSLTAFDDPDDNGSFETSNLLRNNDFFHYKHPGGTVTFTLNYTTENTATVEADLDLYIYGSRARFGVEGDMVGKSTASPDNVIATTEAEAVTIQSLPQGDYMINVMQFTADPFQQKRSDYDILINGVRACPDPVQP